MQFIFRKYICFKQFYLFLFLNRRKYLRKKKKFLLNLFLNFDDIDKIVLENRSKKVKKGNKKEKYIYEKDFILIFFVEFEVLLCLVFMVLDLLFSSFVDYENVFLKRKQKEFKLKVSEFIFSNGILELKYVNVKKKGQNNEDVDEYVVLKMSNIRLYFIGEGVEYYVCDNNKVIVKFKKGWKVLL